MQAPLFIDDENTAIFSPARTYRYVLCRTWSEDPRIMFIGLNPSTADEFKNDPTIRRVISFARGWGYGGVYMLNLFAIVSADPIVLKKHSDPVGDFNDSYLEQMAGKAKDIVFAWGNFKEATERAKIIIEKFPGALCLGINANGTPKHPLYIPANITLQPFKK